MNTELTKQILANAVAELKEHQNTVFVLDRKMYEIFNSTDGDWEINVYIVSDVYLATTEPYDGGICNGTERDAVEFMLPSKPVDENNKVIPADVRSYNIGSSNYSDYKIQPWDIWEEYDLNGWDCDIIKRTLRTKDDPALTPTAQRILDYEKIKHNCDERIRQLNAKLITQFAGTLDGDTNNLSSQEIKALKENE